jgi:hypothetical protein
VELCGRIKRRPPLWVGGQLLDVLAIRSCRAAIFAALAASAASRCTGLSCGRRLRLPLPVRLVLVALAALLLLCCWCWSSGTSRTRSRNRYGRDYGTRGLPLIPPARPAKSSAQGLGAAAEDDRTKTASAAQRPKGGRILVRSGGDGAGGHYAELPDGSGVQQGQPAAGGP